MARFKTSQKRESQLLPEGGPQKERSNLCCHAKGLERNQREIDSRCWFGLLQFAKVELKVDVGVAWFESGATRTAHSRFA